jgi:CBS domain-containing protein
MDQLIPSLADLLGPFRPCFRLEAFHSFACVVEAWLICLGPRTLSEVWQFCVLARARHYCTIYDLFSRSCWDWDELGKLLLALLVAEFAPRGIVWLAVDDTLCHKRGKRVALGGIFLDPVLPSKSRKVLRYAVNYVVLAVVVRPPWRRDRCFALPVLWRAFRKKGQQGHRKRTELAREMAHLVATAAARDFVSWAENPEVGGRRAATTFIAPWGELISVEESPDHEIRRYMTAQPVTVPPSTPIGELCQEMVDVHIHRVLVVADGDRPCGIVTSTDVLAAVARAARKAPREG